MKVAIDNYIKDFKEYSLAHWNFGSAEIPRGLDILDDKISPTIRLFYPTISGGGFNGKTSIFTTFRK